MIPKMKNSATSRESPGIRLRGFNKSSTGEGYGELRTSPDLRGLAHPDTSRKHESDWDVSSPREAHDRSNSGGTSKSGLDETLKSAPHAIRITTEFDVRNVAGKDVIQS